MVHGSKTGMRAWHSLEEKKVWVIGGAGHLGAPITAELDAQGAQVICVDMPGRAEALVRKRKFTRTVPLAIDISDVDALPAAVDALIGTHGLPDGVVHLAFASSKGYRVESLPADEFQRTVDRTLTPTFVLCRELGERMKTRASGSIVLFSSMYGMVSPDPRIYRQPLTPNPIDYGASKAALLQMTRYFAVHYGPSGIRFNCLVPGAFPNPDVQQNHPELITDLSQRTALHRIGLNNEIVGPALFLLTDSASYITGHGLVVDGGWTAF